MEITEGSLADLYVSFLASFNSAVENAAAPDAYADFGEVVPSATFKHRALSSGLLGDLQEHVDEMEWMNVARWLQEIENVEYEAGFVVPRTVIADDLYGQLTGDIARLGVKAGTWLWRLVPEAFINGLTTNWVDGVNVWGNNHLVATWGFDNLDHLPLTVGGFELVVEHLETRLGPDGNALGLKATHLVVGPSQKVRAERLINRQLVNQGETNIHWEDATVVVWPAFTGANAYDWFVADCTDEQPPICALVDREGPEFSAQTRPTDDSAMERNEFRYKVYRRGAVAVVNPWLVQYSRGLDDGSATTTSSAAR